MEKKVLIVYAEYALLYNEKGLLLKTYTTEQLTEKKLTAKQFKASSLKIHVLAPVAIRGGAGTKIITELRREITEASANKAYAIASAKKALVLVPYEEEVIHSLIFAN